ncbi:hypothetical protein LCGC14_1300160, partial [marine sediment metagenome]
MRCIAMMFFTLCSLLFAAGSNINEDTVHFVGQASAFTVGSELVRNGVFFADTDWTKFNGTPSGWSIGSGVATCSGSQSVDTDLTQNITGLTDGRVYRITFEVTAISGGAVTAVFDGTEIEDKNTTAIYTGYVAAVGTDADLDIRGDSAFIGSVDNVSVVAWVGDLNAGGGSTIAGFTGTLTDYMSATGGVLHNESGLDLSDSGGVLRIAAAPFWDTTLQVGTLVKCVFSATFTDGIYEIIAATTETIDIDLSSGGVGAETVEVWIGGAFPNIATCVGTAGASAAVDSTFSEDPEDPDGTYRKRYICVNVDQEVDAVTDFIAETSETALREDGGSRKIIGFYDSLSVVNLGAGGGTYGYRIVSDMDQGGIYYGGAWEAFKRDESFTSIRPNGKWVEWNAKGNDINILELNTSNFEMRNIKMHNTIADSTAEGLLHIDTANFNTQLVNCWFATSSRFVVDDLVGKGNGVLDCY